MSDLDPDSVVVDFQADIKARLLSDTWFSGIDIFTPDDMDDSGKTSDAPADIEQRLEQSLSSLGKGICIIVALPGLQGIAFDAPSIVADNVPVLVRVVENPLVNRGAAGTRKTYSMVGLRITRRLHHYVFRDECTVVVQRSGAVPNPDNLVWDVVAKTSLNIPALVETQP